MSAPRVKGRLSEHEVSDVRALWAQGSSRSMVQLVERIVGDHFDLPSWPARAYVYGVWEYALGRAIEHSAERNQKTYVYASTLDGEPVWVVAWDPKR